MCRRAHQDAGDGGVHVRTEGDEEPVRGYPQRNAGTGTANALACHHYFLCPFFVTPSSHHFFTSISFPLSNFLNNDHIIIAVPLFGSRLVFSPPRQGDALGRVQSAPTRVSALRAKRHAYEKATAAADAAADRLAEGSDGTAEHTAVEAEGAMRRAALEYMEEINYEYVCTCTSTSTHTHTHTHTHTSLCLSFTINVTLDVHRDHVVLLVSMMYSGSSFSLVPYMQTLALKRIFPLLLIYFLIFVFILVVYQSIAHIRRVRNTSNTKG